MSLGGAYRAAKGAMTNDFAGLDLAPAKQVTVRVRIAYRLDSAR